MPKAKTVADEVREQQKVAMEREIKGFVQVKDLTWKKICIEYPHLKGSLSSYYKIGQRDSSYSSVLRFHRAFFGEEKIDNIQISNPTVGSYFRREFEHIEGRYALIRPSLHEEMVIYGYMCEIKWSIGGRNHYLILEYEGASITEGIIYFHGTTQSLCVHLYSGNQQGLLALRAVPGDNDLYGILTSVFPVHDETNFRPGSIPAILVKEGENIPIGEGTIKPGHELYEKCLKLISNVSKKGVIYRGWWDNL